MDAKLVDMKRAAPDPQSGGDCAPCCSSSNEQYPYGLNISLHTEELAKLGMTALPAVGTPMCGMFVGLVTSTSQELNGDEETRMSVQITALQLMPQNEQAEEKNEAGEENAKNNSPGMYRGMKMPAAIVS